MADARTVANQFIALANEQGRDLTSMQLLKLVYIAHGYSLAVRDLALIENEIEAWKYGPVIPDLYHKIKHCGSGPVSTIRRYDVGELDEGEKELIEAVYEAYKGFDGISLSNLTHQRGTPWYSVYRNDRLSIPIPNDLIQQHYNEIVAD